MVYIVHHLPCLHGKAIAINFEERPLPMKDHNYCYTQYTVNMYGKSIVTPYTVYTRKIYCYTKNLNTPKIGNKQQHNYMITS